MIQNSPPRGPDFRAHKHEQKNRSLEEGRALSSTSTIAFCDRMNLLDEANKMTMNGVAATDARLLGEWASG